MTVEYLSTDAAIVIAALVYVVRALVDAILKLIKPDPLKVLADEISLMNRRWEKNQSKLNDMHDWMKPDHTGLQSWRDTSLLHTITKTLGQLFSVVHDNREDVLDKIENSKREIIEVVKSK